MSNLTFQELENLWRQAGGSALYAPMAAAVALAESGGDPTAAHTNTNGSTDRGLWQINSVHGSLSTVNALANARAAVSLSNNGTTWRAWCTAWSDGKCGGTYLGSGAPALQRLPAGASTGTAPSGTAGSDSSTPALKAIGAEYSQIGLPYSFGAEAPGDTFDCSGLTQWAYGVAGISLPRTARAQQAATTRISKTELRPGDLVFWGQPAHHVAMYIGGGMIIQAPQTGEKIDKVKVWGTPTNYGRVTGSGAQESTGVVTAADADGTSTATDASWWNPLTWGDDVGTDIKDAALYVLKYAWWTIEGVGGVLLIIAGFGFLVLAAATEVANRVPPVVGGAAAGRASRPATTPHAAPDAPRPPIKAEVIDDRPRPRARRTPIEPPARRSIGSRKVIDGEVVS